MSDEKIAYVKMHVTDETVAAATQALVEALTGVTTVLQNKRILAQKELETESPGVVTAQEMAVKDIKTKYKQPDVPKKRKFLEKKKAEIATKRHELGDPIVMSFEKSYLATRVTADQVLKTLSTFAFKGCKIEQQDAATCKEVFITPDGKTKEKALELYLGKNRFLPIKESGAYLHRTNGREYVPDRFDVYISRYVIRGLNTEDRKRIDAGNDPSMIATNSSPMPSDDTQLKAAIYEHCRKKSRAEAGTAFISVSHTKHKVTGSTGAVFGNSASGSAIIDLSKVAKTHRIDLHTPEAVTNIFGVTEVEPDMPKPSKSNKRKTEVWNDNATARDVIRTREILIGEKVPADAVVAIRLGATGAWHELSPTTHKPDTTKAATLPSKIPPEWQT